MMTTKILTASVLALSCLFTAPLIAGGDSFESALKAAKEAQKKAASVGGEWRDVGKFLKKAEKAAKDGDAKKAMKLVKKATSQCELGIAQAKAESEKPIEFPSYMK
jgi:hypothetical protein